MSVISGRTNRVTATIPVGTRPDDVAVNPRTNTIYDLDEPVAGPVARAPLHDLVLVLEAFLASLTSRRLDLRSAFGSFEIRVAHQQRVDALVGGAVAGPEGHQAVFLEGCVADCPLGRAAWRSVPAR